MHIQKLVPIGLLFALAGCGMPSGMAALSYTMNGISYASSGKGVADHALSAAADKDCAVLRAVEGINICTSDHSGKDGTLMTMIDSVPVEPNSAARFTGHGSPPSSSKVARSQVKPGQAVRSGDSAVRSGDSAVRSGDSTVAFESIYGTGR